MSSIRRVVTAVSRATATVVDSGSAPSGGRATNRRVN